VASSWHTRGPIEGTRHPHALYLSPAQEVSFTPLRVGWYLVVRVFPIGNTREHRLKSLGSDLPTTAYAPVWSYGGALALAGSRLRMVT
jgi:hypothetical protein